MQQQVLSMPGDRDNKTLEIYRTLPNAQLLVLPNTAHPIEVVDKARLAFEIKSFLRSNQIRFA